MVVDLSNPNWPPLGGAGWKDTQALLHPLTQMMGKVLLRTAPFMNHWWHSALHTTTRGLTTTPMPVRGRFLELELDLLEHQLWASVSSGERERLTLHSSSVADLYDGFERLLERVGCPVPIWPRPVEVAVAIPFPEDREVHTYDPDSATRFFRALLQADRLFKAFRAAFIGKASPVHFFWGSFDLTVSRYSGRRAPPHPGGAPNVGAYVMRQAYSHEVCSAGFWPGGGAFPDAAFYSYVYPEPSGFPYAPVRPEGAFYHSELQEFVLPWEVVRSAPDPDQAVLDFLYSTYVSAATLGGWNRKELEADQPFDAAAEAAALQP